jgi:DNA-binding transcriptional ArsR family regulator
MVRLMGSAKATRVPDDSVAPGVDAPRTGVNGAKRGAAHPEQLGEEQVRAAVASLSMLAEPTRLRLLWTLRDAELGVTALAERAGCSATAASQHLAKLRLAGLVDQRAQGRERLYRLQGGHLRRLLDEALAHADHASHDLPHHD